MPAENIIEGITFDSDKGAVYVPIDELATELGITTDWDTKSKQYLVGDKPVAAGDVRVLFDGTPVLNILSLDNAGLDVEFEASTNEYSVMSGTHFGVVSVPEQWVEVNLSAQVLRGYQGNRLIIETKISTGKKGFSTPSGEFTTGPEKSRHRTSSKYDDAPMPYSVQFYGGYFIHGSSSVPRYPASHGCVRMPLTGMNAAKYFFNWVHLNVPVSLRRGWSAKVIEIDAAS